MTQKDPVRGGGREVHRTEGDVNLSDARTAWQAAHLDEKTRALLAADAEVFLHQSLSTPCLNALERATGAAITDTAGRRLLDFHGNSVHQVGYGHPRVVEAVKHQLEELPFCPRRYTNEVAVRFAQKLVEVVPGGFEKVLLAPGGTAAIGMALKLARLVTGRWKVVSFWDAFHGASLDAISVGGERLFRDQMGPLLPGVVHVPPPADRGGKRDRGLDPLKYLEYVFEKEGEIGALLAEPMRCTTVEVAEAAYWQRARELCDEHGALLIFDEIPIGLGRSGRWCAFEHFGVTPDVLVLGKGLGGGVFPMAAMLTRAKFDVGEHVALGHYTHEKSPVGCAAGLATLEVIEDERLVARSERLGAEFRARLEGLREKHSVIADVRGVGLLVGVELAHPEGREASVRLTESVLYGCLERGMSFKVSDGTVLTLTPALTIAEEDLWEAVDVLGAVLGSV